MDERNKSINVEQDKNFLMKEQTRLLLQNSKTAIAVNLSIAFLTYLAIPSTHKYWLWLIIGASSLRLVTYLWCISRFSQSLKTRTIYTILLISITIQGAAWGVVSLILYAAVSDLQKFYLIAIICGMSGGAILTLTPSFLAFACFALSSVAPLVLSLLLESNKTFQHAGLMGVVYIVAVLALARRIKGSSVELMQSHRSLELTGQELAQHKERLELLVEDRTKKLQESRENYRRLIEEINDVIFELDSHGIVRYISPVITSILGHRPEEILGIHYSDFFYPDDLPVAREMFKKVMSGSLQPSEYRILDSTGEPHWVRVSSRAIVEDNSPVGIRGMLTDIDNEKRAESEKEKLLQRFYENQKAEAIGTLAGGIAHDFNNLLMGIQGRASLIATELESSDPSLEHTQAIEEHVRSAGSLTAQLLGTARGGTYDPKPTELNDLIAHSSNMFKRTRKEIQIHSKMSNTQIVVDVDGHQIEQVLLNMYVNAWQAMPDGGEIHLESSVVTLNESYCETFNASPGAYAKISVTDSGIGMDEATRQRIFDPFFTTKDKARGTGLGLASAYGIIKNHEGFITVYSKLGHGATFNIYLPVSAQQANKSIPAKPGIIRGSETILLVDDEEIIIEVGQALLRELGYTVIAAKGGEQAVECMQQKGEEIELVILDMIMPGMDGGVTFDRLRELYPSLPVILSSGYSFNGQATEIMQRGCNGFLQKPFTLPELSQKIRAILDRKEIVVDD